jgi:hypothetical protein
MFTKKELSSIIVCIIIFEFIIYFPFQNEFNPLLLFIPIIILFTSILAKKIASEYYCISIEHRFWEFQRFGFYSRSQFDKPLNSGLIFPFFISLFSLGEFKMFTFLQFDAKNIPEKRILKERGYKRKTEINDSDLGFTSAWGFFSLIILAIIGPIIDFTELSKYSIYFGLWNMIPFSNLDGTKLFFGSVLTWAVLLITFIIGLAIIVM